MAIEAPKLHDRQRALGAAVLRAAAGPGEPTVVEVGEPYSREHAIKVIEASIADYQDAFGD